jgi:hypothetical protein
MTTATAIDTREQVKADLCNYLTNTAKVSDHEILKKAVTAIKKAADDYDTDLLSKNFAPRHHEFLKSIVSRLQALDEAAREEYVSESDAYEKVTEIVAELDQALPISVSPTQSVLESWAIKIIDGEATHQEAIAALTSKKPIIRKK